MHIVGREEVCDYAITDGGRDVVGGLNGLCTQFTPATSKEVAPAVRYISDSEVVEVVRHNITIINAADDDVDSLAFACCCLLWLILIVNKNGW